MARLELTCLVGTCLGDKSRGCFERSVAEGIEKGGARQCERVGRGGVSYDQLCMYECERALLPCIQFEEVRGAKVGGWGRALADRLADRVELDGRDSRIAPALNAFNT